MGGDGEAEPRVRRRAAGGCLGAAGRMARRLERHQLNDAVIAAAVSTKASLFRLGRNKESPANLAARPKPKGSNPLLLFLRPSWPPACIPRRISPQEYYEGAGLQVLLETRQKKRQQKIDQYDLTYHPSKI